MARPMRCSKRFPAAEVVRSDRNLGFAGGSNLGIQRALALGADHVLLLNNDTDVDAGFLAPLVAEACKPDVGAVCPVIVFAERPEVIWYAGGRYDPTRGYNGRALGKGEQDGERWRGVRETDWASGAAMLVPRAALDKVGLLDERLFLYYEDIDWSLRARKAGLRLLVTGESRVRHKVSMGSGGEEHGALIAYYSMRNQLAICAQNAPLSRARGLRRQLATMGAHVVHARRGARPLTNLRYALRGWADYRRGRFGDYDAVNGSSR